MIEFVLLSLPSFVAGGFALAWYMERSARKSGHKQNAVLRAAVTEAVGAPDRFQARIGRLANRKARLDGIRERRKAERAKRGE